MQPTLKERFEGCLLGVVLGDCLGCPYESIHNVDPKNLRRFLEEAESNMQGDDFLRYTDDSNMTFGLAKSLIANKGLNVKHLAQQWTTDYFDSRKRGYGMNVIEVFKELRATNYKDPYLPARQQFDGIGSYGNGAAMRVAPVALFNYSKPLADLIHMANETAVITHTHEIARVGAILQAIAIQKCLSGDVTDAESFLNYLEESIQSVDGYHQYVKSLNNIRDLLRKNETSIQRIVEYLGNGVSAIEAVPAAIFSFVKHINDDSLFRRTAEFAISLGGDTDTIASMACAMAGAHVGSQAINQNTIKYCENSDVALQLAHDLYDLSFLRTPKL